MKWTPFSILCRKWVETMSRRVAHNKIDPTLRKCQCGHFRTQEHFNTDCARECPKTFTMFEYAPGYLPNRKNWRPSSSVNTCHKCELKFLASILNHEPLSESSRMKMEQDALLLDEWRLSNDRQRKDATHTHGSEITRLMDSLSTEPDRDKARRRVIQRIMDAGL